jgi:hypothetical protein
MQQTYNGMPNRLYHPRTKSPTDSLPDDMVGASVINAIVCEPNSELFMSSRPHGPDPANPGVIVDQNSTAAGTQSSR